MIGIGVITHGKFAEGLKDATRMIMGENEKFEVLGLYEDTNLEEFQHSVVDLTDSIEAEKGVLLFVDMFGATPFNTIATIREEINQNSNEIQVITGVNLPMLMEALATRGGITVKELTNNIVSAGKESIKSLEMSINQLN